MGLVMALRVACGVAAAIRDRRPHRGRRRRPGRRLCIAGPLSVDIAEDEIDALAPTLGFLAAVLVLGRLCASRACSVGRRGARPGPSGSPRSLLAWVLLVGTAITTVLSLDATVVLFTPVVVAAAVRVGVSARPHLHATAHLANSASLLLPVSNLTNLLAYEATGLSFARFAALMVLPLLVVLIVEYVGTRLCFAGDLRSGGSQTSPTPVTRRHGWPCDGPRRDLAGPAVRALDVEPGVGRRRRCSRARRAPRRARGSPRARCRWCGPGLPAVRRPWPWWCGGTRRVSATCRRLVDQPDTLLGLLGVAAVGAVTANLLNNLPATLLLLPFVAAGGPGRSWPCCSG